MTIELTYEALAAMEPCDLESRKVLFGRRCRRNAKPKRLSFWKSSNERPLDRLDSFIRGTAGKRLTYADVLALFDKTIAAEEQDQ